MRHRVREAGLEDEVVIDSAGTGAWHVGHAPDARARAEARRRGVAMEGSARQFGPGDFARFDLVVAMDAQNAADLRALAPDAAARAKVRLMREFDAHAPHRAEVPDPYYGGDDGFAEVFDMLDAAVRGLLDHLRTGPPAG